MLHDPDIFDSIKLFRKTPLPDPVQPRDMKSQRNKVAPSRVSESPSEGGAMYSFETDKYLVQPGYQFEVIPLIRKLALGNQSVSQALSNIVNLANTGVKIRFDSAVDPKKVDEMKQHLERVVKNWHYGIPGVHGLANKLFAQAMISGATATETIPNKDFTGVYRVVMPLPETVRFLYNKATVTYEPHQVAKTDIFKASTTLGYRPLNPNTFRYFAINGDTESPYGNPPYLPSLGPLEDQKIMLENIKFIISQIGVVGFLELMVAKPDKDDLEGEPQYKARLAKYLDECKANIAKSMRDGVVVGYEDDHTFAFHSTSKNAAGVSELFNNNQLLVHSGLKQDPSLSGQGTSGSESAITIVFTKLLSELKNIQISVAAQLEFMFEMELRLAGYDFKYCKAEFEPSTIQDDLKIQQAREIKIRNARQLRMDGIIDQDQYADEMGYDEAAEDEPVVPFAPVKEGTGDPAVDAQQKAAREKSKDASDRKVRAKNKPQGAKKVR